MIEDTKLFHIGTILTITTGRLVSPKHIGGVYEICEWMTGETGLMIHQLPRVSREIQPYLEAQYPQFAEDQVHMPEDLNGWKEIFTWMELTYYDKYGEMLPVARIPKDAHTEINPLIELAMNYPHLAVAPVVVPESGREMRNETAKD